MHKGSTHSQEAKDKCSQTKMGTPAWNKGLHPEYMQGENHHMFGKHHTAESKAKCSLSKMGSIPWNKGKGFSVEERLRRRRIAAEKCRRKHRRARGGNKKAIQMTYEDNIKQFGTLTCYLCLKPIEFGKDHLEHKTPLSRGGSYEYENLGVSCARCNLKKNNRTVEEFLSRKD